MSGFISGFLAVFLLGLAILQLVLEKYRTFGGWVDKQINSKLYWILTLIYMVGGLSMTFYIVYY